MTAVAGMAEGESPWRRRLLSILLAVSLALNLCFVAGAVWSRMHRPPGPAERIREMSQELNLNPEQHAAFERYVRIMRARADLMHEEIEPLISGAWAEVAKPQADVASIMKIFDEAAEKRRGFQRDVSAETLDFLATLSPEQRAKFVAIMRERRAPWMQPRPRGPRP